MKIGASEAASIPDNHRTRGPFLIVAFLLVVVSAAAMIGFLPRKRTREQLDAKAAQLRRTPPVVSAILVKRSKPTIELLLPGNVTPITEAYVYARASGYVKRRYVDIGDRVLAGQLLAEIDAPELDQQVTQAQAALSQAEAQLGQAQAMQEQLIATRDLAALTWNRYRVLQATGAVSRQDGDQQSTNSKTADANVSAGEKNVRAAQNFVAAAEATLERLRTLQAYERVTAPFAGIVTSRNVDVGALITTGGAGLGPARPLASPTDLPGNGEMFRVAQINRLRILISAPQSAAPAIVVGQDAKVELPEFPGRLFPGKVTRTSSSLDAGSRTLLTEVQVANPEGILLPGMYARVSLITNRAEPPLLVPDASLVASSRGTQVAVLARLTAQDEELAKSQGYDPALFGQSRIVRFYTVRPGRDYGVDLEILGGLPDDVEVAVDPGDAVREGSIVQPRERTSK